MKQTDKGQISSFSQEFSFLHGLLERVQLINNALTIQKSQHF